MQSAVLLSHVVCLSVMLVDCDHIGWNSSKIILRLVSLERSLSADPNIMDLLQGELPEIWAQSDPPPVDLSVEDHISATSDPVHFVFGSRVGFLGSRIEWRYFRLHQIQVGSRPPSWIISNGNISAMTHSIHLYSTHCTVIFAIAQLSCCSL